MKQSHLNESMKLENSPRFQDAPRFPFNLTAANLALAANNLYPQLTHNAQVKRATLFNEKTILIEYTIFLKKKR